jgi:hypothetical protein
MSLPYHIGNERLADEKRTYGAADTGGFRSVDTLRKY